MGTNGVLRPWQVDKGWSDRLLPEIKRNLGEHLLMAAPREEDVERATDVMQVTLTLPTGLRVACRVRRLEQLQRDPSYGEQFTIRTRRPSGAKCELTKIIEGWGSHYFYGFAGDVLVTWFLGDLNVFRLWFNHHLWKHGGMPPGDEIENRDGTRFRVFGIEDLPPEFLIARAMPPPGLRWQGGYVGVNPIDLSGGDGAPTSSEEQMSLPIQWPAPTRFDP